MLTGEEAGEKARRNFLEGLNCSQAVAAVFTEQLGLEGEAAEMLLKAASPFGGGTCRMREMCGAVTGALMVLGLFMGSSTGDKEKKDALYKAGQEFCRRFKEANGSVICRELLGLVPMGQGEELFRQGKSDPHKADSPLSACRTAEYYKSRPCPDKCASAARLLQEMIIEGI